MVINKVDVVQVVGEHEYVVWVICMAVEAMRMAYSYAQYVFWRSGSLSTIQWL